MNRRLLALLFLSIPTVSVAQWRFSRGDYIASGDFWEPPVRSFFREEGAPELPPPPPKETPKEKHDLGGAESVTYYNGFCRVYIGWCSGAYYWNGYQWWPKYNSYNNRYYWNGYRWVYY